MFKHIWMSNPSGNLQVLPRYAGLNVNPPPIVLQTFLPQLPITYKINKFQYVPSTKLACCTYPAAAAATNITSKCACKFPI